MDNSKIHSLRLQATEYLKSGRTVDPKRLLEILIDLLRELDPDATDQVLED